MTQRELENAGYSIVHAAWAKGYVSRKSTEDTREAIPCSNRIKAMYGATYYVDFPNCDSTRYCMRRYYKQHRRYFLIRDLAHESFDDLISAQDKQGAVVRAWLIWDKLSGYDRARTERAYLVYAYTDDDGIIDLDTAELVHTFK